MEAALAKSDAVVKGSIETTRQEHFYEETAIALVVPIGEDNEYKVFASTPNILMTQHNVSIFSNFKANLRQSFQVAMFLGVPFSRVLVTSKRVKTKM